MTSSAFVRQLDKGMGEAVFRRTYARPNETWADVAKRVALGNTAVVPEGLFEGEREALEAAITSGGVLMSGRHLQHGDETQPLKNIELMTNCSTAATSFIKFYLLMNGSGVGRAYDDALCLTDWRRMPSVELGLPEDHPDFEAAVRMSRTVGDVGEEEARAGLIECAAAVARVERKIRGRVSYIKDAEGFYHTDDKITYFRVPDTREGWAEALEVLEAMTFAGESDRTLKLSFASIRPEGSPIGGMQDRPASGPVSPMRAFRRCSVAVPTINDLWLQALTADHFFSEEVQVGGARRAARMATKYWKDPGIFEFIRVKDNGGYWTANQSVAVDAEFWRSVDEGGLGARVLEAVTSQAYASGEPGLINHDKLDQAVDRAPISAEAFFGGHGYRLGTGRKLMEKVLEASRTAPVQYITNPCVTGDTLIDTLDVNPVCVRDLVGKRFETWTPDGWLPSTDQGFWSNGVKPVFEMKVSIPPGDAYGLYIEAVKATANHRFRKVGGSCADKGEWIELQNLRAGDWVAVDETSEYHEESAGQIVSIVPAGEEEVFDCSIPGANSYYANGVLSHNCGEISLSVIGGYCVIADVAPAACLDKTFEELGDLRRRADAGDESVLADFEEWDRRFERAAVLAARALVRVNQQRAFYQGEVDRTQRIGVSLTGIHEYAWLRFGLTFDALLDDRSRAFWARLEAGSEACKDAANDYADALGVARPVTVTTIKPSGTVSKLFGLTEGAHLPAYAFGIRWVQYQDSDPRLQELKDQGHPNKKYDQNPSVTLIGFPVVPLISKLGMPYVITATEASPEDQYEYLRRLEKYWLGEKQANQISYTLKISTATCSAERFHEVVKTQQPTIKCCAIMPTRPDEELEKIYGYLPEESCSLARLEQVVIGINNPSTVEDIDLETLRCASGACPL